MIHPTSDVKTIHIGVDTLVWQYAVILEKAVIGSHCNINCHTFIENDVIIGDNVTIKSGVYLWDGITIEDNVFVGPNVTFTNDKYPRSKRYPETFQRTIVSKNASIGASSVILGGIRIGSFALVGAGSVVTKDIPDYALVVGNPAKVVGWVDSEGNKLERKDDKLYAKDGKVFIIENNILKSI